MIKRADNVSWWDCAFQEGELIEGDNAYADYSVHVLKGLEILSGECIIGIVYVTIR